MPEKQKDDSNPCVCCPNFIPVCNQYGDLVGFQCRLKHCPLNWYPMENEEKDNN